jgi:hypothetical protein
MMGAVSRLTHWEIGDLFLLLLGADPIPAHQRLPAASEWNDFPVELREGTYRLQRSQDQPRLRLRTNFQPELQKSVDHL